MYRPGVDAEAQLVLVNKNPGGTTYPPFAPPNDKCKDWVWCVSCQLYWSSSQYSYWYPVSSERGFRYDANLQAWMNPFTFIGDIDLRLRYAKAVADEEMALRGTPQQQQDEEDHRAAVQSQHDHATRPRWGLRTEL